VDDLSLEDLIAYVGAEKFEAACRCAWTVARSDWPEDLSMVPHDLADPLWFPRGAVEDGRVEKRLVLALTLYRRMPCYANLMYPISFVEGVACPQVRKRFWSAYRELLEQPDDRLAGPVAYTLHVDYFEGYSILGEVWSEMTRLPEPTERRRRSLRAKLDEPARRRLTRVLEVAAAVPWDMKAPLLTRLSSDLGWHMPIFRCLYGSVFEVVGSVDRAAAGKLLQQLKLPSATPGVDKLARRSLSSSVRRFVFEISE